MGTTTFLHQVKLDIALKEKNVLLVIYRVYRDMPSEYELETTLPLERE